MRILIVLISLFLLSASAEALMASNTRVTNPNALSVELLGRGMLYSVDYDMVMNENMAAGFGIGSDSMNFHGTDNSTGQSATFVPAYFNYYFMKDAGSIFATAGATIILNHSSVVGTDTSTGSLQIPSSSILPEFGVGYENRGDSGFLFRVTGYAIAGQSLTPWVGFTFGYAF